MYKTGGRVGGWQTGAWRGLDVAVPSGVSWGMTVGSGYGSPGQPCGAHSHGAQAEAEAGHGMWCPAGASAVSLGP